jgi:hypothetical protein
VKQKIDAYARANLEYLAARFTPYWGEMEACGEEVVFANPPPPLRRVKILCKKKKSLLGGLYSLQIIGEIDKEGLVRNKTPIRLYYRGLVSKGKAFFKHQEDINSDLIKHLNNDVNLINILSLLDLETGEIWLADDKYIIVMSPISGSFMYMVFPPLRYSGSLPEEEIRQLNTSLFRTSELLQSRSQAV